MFSLSHLTHLERRTVIHLLIMLVVICAVLAWPRWQGRQSDTQETVQASSVGLDISAVSLAAIGSWESPEGETVLTIEPEGLTWHQNGRDGDTVWYGFFAGTDIPTELVTHPDSHRSYLVYGPSQFRRAVIVDGLPSGTLSLVNIETGMKTVYRRLGR